MCSVFYVCRQFTLPFSISIQAAESVIILFTLSDRICESLSRHLIALKVLVIGRDLIDQLAVDDLHDTVCGRLYDLMVTGGEDDHARELLHSVVQGCDGLHVFTPSSPANSILPRNPRTYVTSFSGEYWVSQSTIVSSLLNSALLSFGKYA